MTYKLPCCQKLVHLRCVCEHCSNSKFSCECTESCPYVCGNIVDIDAKHMTMQQKQQAVEGAIRSVTTFSECDENINRSMQKISKLNNLIGFLYAINLSSDDFKTLSVESMIACALTNMMPDSVSN